jgi:hypothetical protein
MVANAYSFFSTRMKAFPNLVRVNLFRRLPSYSFYKFDREVVFALYPNSKARKDVPTFRVNTVGRFGEFFQLELDDLDEECRDTSHRELKELAAKYQVAANEQKRQR